MDNGLGQKHSSKKMNASQNTNPRLRNTPTDLYINHSCVCSAKALQTQEWFPEKIRQRITPQMVVWQAHAWNLVWLLQA